MVLLPILGSDSSYALNPQKIIAIGLNYRDHIAESPSVLARRAGGASGADPAEPAEPILFAKTPNVLVGNGEPIPLPLGFMRRYPQFPKPRCDYEAELAVVMGKRCRDVSVGEALSFVLGYSCFNDVSQRDIQNGDRSGWFRGKSFDGFGPIGPVLVPAALVPDPQGLRILCRLNGRIVQESSTKAMIFGVAELISFISHNLTLEPGDIIATGTPSGVGPLKAGDLVEVEIEGIGVLANPVVER
jgi:2-keto-4-pentenoate hydratase/2-oxohepta-3-ene-1,7-dioic acid hydratase in catechol pathway